MESHQEQLKVQYKQRFAEAADYRDSVWRILCSNFFSRYISTGSRILELGAGWGEFINNIIATEKYAMDLNPDAGSHLSAEVKCIHQDCSSQWEMEPECLDVVFTSNFLEHLPDKASVARKNSQEIMEDEQ